MLLVSANVTLYINLSLFIHKTTTFKSTKLRIYINCYTNINLYYRNPQVTKKKILLQKPTIQTTFACGDDSSVINTSM